MEYFGIKIDDEVNSKTKGSSGVTELSAPDSKVKAYMIPTNEELMIARDTESIVKAL